MLHFHSREFVELSFGIVNSFSVGCDIVIWVVCIRVRIWW